MLVSPVLFAFIIESKLFPAWSWGHKFRF
jgi:hypothetical protein